MNARTHSLRPLQPLRRWVCPSCQLRRPRAVLLAPQLRALQTDTPPAGTPWRKQAKEAARQLKHEARQQQAHASPGADAAQRAAADALARWELTVGIEIHAQLNTERKLFSHAAAAASDTPNTHTARFDVALPGSQPAFQPATVLPAIRAALALDCTVQRRSRFDRKHYFYPDQPAGYQITQYYAPLARDGHIRLEPHDGIAAADSAGGGVTVGIQQIQLEQDTAKTVQQPPDAALLDFNRVGHPLIEIITRPHMHHPATAAACVRKIQLVLQAVGAVTTGMELGGLRADVNVSVRRRGDDTAPLGTRTEIKNLSSFRAIEDAVTAERDRQIALLEAGGTVMGETRGWTLGSTATYRLRGKEGEVDYRYMPDPDLPPVLIDDALVQHLREGLPMLPDEQIHRLTTIHGLSRKDAQTLAALDDGTRLDYFQAIGEALRRLDGESSAAAGSATDRIVGNWVLHELGGLLSKAETAFDAQQVPVDAFARILHHLCAGQITGKTAKQLLADVFAGGDPDIDATIARDNLRLQSLSDVQYQELAAAVVDEHPDMAEKVRLGQRGKLQWLVGQMMRRSGGRMDARRAAAALEPLLPSTSAPSD